MGGGAQPAGTMAYPDYIKDPHALLLSDGVTNMLDVVDMAVMDNPYPAAFSYDPSTDLDKVDAEHSELDAEIAGAITALSWSTMVSTAEASADSVLMNDTDIDAAVTAFETKHEATLARSRGRMAAGMAAIGAETSSAFWIGLGLMEGAFDNAVAEHRSVLKRETNARRVDFITQAVNTITNIISQKVNIKAMLENVTRQVTSQRIIASKEFLNEELQIAERDATWPIEQLHAGSALLGAVAGVGMRKTPMPAWASAIAGLMSGVGAVAPLAMASGSVPLGLLISIVGGALGGAAGATEGT